MDIYTVGFIVNVTAVFSINGIRSLVNEEKHVFAFAPHGNFTSILPEVVISAVAFLGILIYFIS